MKSYVKNERFVIELNGRIDSNNSDAVDREIRQALTGNPGLPLVLDASALAYISSSGLRVLMRLVKGGHGDMTITGVSPEVYEIFETTGMTCIMNVKKRMRQVDIEGCPIIGEGAFGTVYRLDGDTVVKVYRNGEASLPIIEGEIAKSRVAFVSGMATAIPFDIVRVGDQYGSVFEMIDAHNCNSLVKDDPAALEALIPRYAAFLKEMHGMELAPGQLEFARDSYLENLEAFAPVLEPEVRARLRALLEAMPEDLHLLHGDAQLKNIMLSSGEIVAIDLDHICTGNPVFEFASLYATYVAFNEDDPTDTLVFMGLDKDTAERIYRETLLDYLGDVAPAALEAIERKIRTLAYLRFLEILVIELADLHTPLKDLQIRHAAEHLKALAFQVEDLTM